MVQWSFLTNHARALLCIAHDPGLRLRDMAEALGITERSAFAIVADLTAAGYVLKDRDGRRPRYPIQHHIPLPGPPSRQPPRAAAPRTAPPAPTEKAPLPDIPRAAVDWETPERLAPSPTVGRWRPLGCGRAFPRGSARPSVICRLPMVTIPRN